MLKFGSISIILRTRESALSEAAKRDIIIIMRPEDILGLLRQHPFEPFRIHVPDGVSYDVRHPNMVIVQRSKIIVAVPGPEGPDGPAERTVQCALIHITRTEVMNGSARRS